MITLIKRLVKGSAITAAENDSNMTIIENAINSLEQTNTSQSQDIDVINAKINKIAKIPTVTTTGTFNFIPSVHGTRFNFDTTAGALSIGLLDFSADGYGANNGIMIDVTNIASNTLTITRAANVVVRGVPSSKTLRVKPASVSSNGYVGATIYCEGVILGVTYYSVQGNIEVV